MPGFEQRSILHRRTKTPPERGFCEDGRYWDRTTTSRNPLARTEADYSSDLQEERGSSEDDDVPLEPTPFHRALGQPVDKDDEDDAPLGSA